MLKITKGHPSKNVKIKKNFIIFFQLNEKFYLSKTIFKNFLR
jgi:hypothetical protein